MCVKSRLLCPECGLHDAVIKNGFFVKNTGHYSMLQKPYCKRCKHNVSEQTETLTYRERKAHRTQSVMRVAMEALSQRGTARRLGLNPNTVAKKVVRLGAMAIKLLGARGP